MAPVMVTGKMRTVPRPRFSRFRCWLKALSSFFSSSSSAVQYCAWSSGDLPGSSPDACPQPSSKFHPCSKNLLLGLYIDGASCLKYPPLTSSPKAQLWFCLSRPVTSDQLTFPPLTLPTSFQLPSICPGCVPYLACPSCLLSPHLTVMWGQLVQQLLDPVFLPGTVDVGDLVLWKAAEKLVYLGGHGGWEKTIETRGDAVGWWVPAFLRKLKSS